MAGAAGAAARHAAAGPAAAAASTAVEAPAEQAPSSPGPRSRWSRHPQLLCNPPVPGKLGQGSKNFVGDEECWPLRFLHTCLLV